ncbi:MULTISPECIES: hypothetical protein [Paraprevotella]|jgi:hypothetical protein|uniref:hypothetical protein n=1 Tax=Paraprevotella TaxID=577309 RepID=UPI00257E15E9|nr:MULTISPECIES: hypothetical protein [Paraprevotella]MBS4808699.1 hypothetical protein [Paraprevotella sp.]
MNQEERKQKINAILGEVKKRVEFPGINPELWIAAEEGKPGEPEFEEWMRCCTEMVDAYQIEEGKKDTDSIFAWYVRTYGRREA